MKNYFYIMANASKTAIHGGTCSDLLNMLAFYKKLPHSLIDGSNLNRLVYLEEYTQEENAIQRVKEVTAFTIQQKKELIETINPGYIELVPGKNIEI